MKIVEDTIRSSLPNRCCNCGALNITIGCLPCLLKLIGRVPVEVEDNRPDSMYIPDIDLECAKVRADRWCEPPQLSPRLLGEDYFGNRPSGRCVQFIQHNHAKRNESWDEVHDQPYWQEDLRYTNV